MSVSEEIVAVLGAGGSMGVSIARNIAQAGVELHVWNRSKQKMASLAGSGAKLCDTPAEAARGASVVLTMVSDLQAVLDCMQGQDGALGGIGAGAIWVQMSTIGVQGTSQCAELASRHAVQLVDAPVLGTKQPAEEGKLIVLASGPEALRARLQEILDSIGQRTIWVADAPGMASRLKMVTNSWVLAVVEGAAETIALAEGLGVDPELFLEAVAGGTLDLPYLRMKGRAVIQREFPPAFKLALAAKDAGLMEDAARECGLHLPLIETIRKQMQAAAAEHGEEDIAATYWASAPGARASNGASRHRWGASARASTGNPGGMSEQRDDDELARAEAEAAASEAGQIGGRLPEEDGADPAQRAVQEGGGGVSEGFELAEEDLIEHASHGDQQSARPGYHLRDDRDDESDPQQGGEADSFRSSETDDGQW